MKNWTKILLFLCLQCSVIGLSILIGWNYGLPADRQKLKNQETRLQEGAYLNQRENNQNIELLQNIVELLQTGTSANNVIDIINGSINFRIMHSNGWTEFGNPRGLEWPEGEDQFNLILRIAKHRQKYPICYTNCPPWMTKESLSRIFDEAEKCKNRRATDSKWTPPPTTEVYKVEVIEPTNAPYSSPSAGSKR